MGIYSSYFERGSLTISGNRIFREHPTALQYTCHSTRAEIAEVEMRSVVLKIPTADDLDILDRVLPKNLTMIRNLNLRGSKASHLAAEACSGLNVSP